MTEVQRIQSGGNGDSVFLKKIQSVEVSTVQNGHIDKEEQSRKETTLTGSINLLQQELYALKSENQHLKRDKDELEQASMARSDSAAVISLLKCTKQELESKIEELEDNLDEVTIRSESLEQAKSRLELSLQTHLSQHKKEMEACEEEMDQLQSTMNKKVKNLYDQLEDALQEKQAAVKAHKLTKRERVFFSRSDSFSECVSSSMVISDLQTQLESEQSSNKSSSIVKTLRMQLEDAQMNEEAAHKQHRRLQNDYDELQVQNDELMQKKMELESKVSELHHEKLKLNEQLEEDQDEMEQMKSDQESQLSQITILQKELAGLKDAIKEMQHKSKETEKEISELTSIISNLEYDRARTASIDRSEFKVRELQETLEFEQTANRRLEAQVQRLKALMEKMENEAANSRLESDMVRKLQKQIRELRADITDAERKEFDECNRRKIAETELEKLRAEHVLLRSELKLIQRKLIQRELKDLEFEDTDDKNGIVINDNTYPQNGQVSKSKSRPLSKHNGRNSDSPWQFKGPNTVDPQFLSDDDDEYFTQRKHATLEKNFMKVPDTNSSSDVVDGNSDSPGSSFLYKDDPELARIRAKYIEKKDDSSYD